MKKEEKYLLFFITGGHGKCIMATSVIRSIKIKYPDYRIVIISSWDGPFFFNPNVYRFYTYNQIDAIYFFDDYLNENTIILKHDPYDEIGNILGKEHLTKTWTKMFDLPYDGYKPDLYINPRELEIAKDKIKPDGRPIMLLQSHGGAIGGGQYSKKSWYRDIPINVAQIIVNHFKNKYRILHIKLPEQPNLQGVEPLTLPLRELYGVFPLSTKRLFMDSFSNHVAAALELQSTILWVGNAPSVFGYPEHINILPNAKIINQFNKYKILNANITGFVQEFPYDTVDVFNVDEIIDAVERQK